MLCLVSPPVQVLALHGWLALLTAPPVCRPTICKHVVHNSCAVLPITCCDDPLCKGYTYEPSTGQLSIAPAAANASIMWGNGYTLAAVARSVLRGCGCVGFQQRIEYGSHRCINACLLCSSVCCDSCTLKILTLLLQYAVAHHHCLLPPQPGLVLSYTQILQHHPTPPTLPHKMHQIASVTIGAAFQLCHRST